jgi:hypothetical protein
MIRELHQICPEFFRHNFLDKIYLKFILLTIFSMYKHSPSRLFSTVTLFGSAIEVEIHIFLVKDILGHGSKNSYFIFGKF